MRLILVRHGETGWLAQGRYQGQRQVPLSELGRRQVATLAGRLAGERIQAVWSSDLLRARQTAEAIATPLALPLRLETRLREIHFGVWEGLTFEEIRQIDPTVVDSMQRDPLHFTPPGGESLTRLASRVQSLLADLDAQRADEVVLALVSHGGPLRVLICLALGLPPEAHWRFALGTASLSRLELYKEGATLTCLNDQHHMDEAACRKRVGGKEEEQWDS
jgi:alpha-ribazole phosphatase